MSNKPTRRRYTHFSLRALLLAMTVICVWLGITASAARQQRVAADAILKAGGKVNFDYQSLPDDDPDGWKFNENAPPRAPSWLRRFLGNDYFRNVTGVSFYKCIIPERDFAQLANFQQLKHVKIICSKLVPEGSDIPRLINDADLAILTHSQNLSTLQIAGSTIEGTGLKHLKSLPNLGQIDLDNNDITHKGLSELSKLTQLKRLMLGGNSIAPEEIRELQRFLPNAKISR